MSYSKGVRCVKLLLSAQDRKWLQTQARQTGERLEDIILQLLHQISQGEVAGHLSGKIVEPRELSVGWFLTLADLPRPVRKWVRAYAFVRGILSVGALYDYRRVGASKFPYGVRKHLFPLLDAMGLSMDDTPPEVVTVAYKVRLPQHYANTLQDLAYVMGSSPAAVIAGMVQAALDAHAGQPSHPEIALPVPM